MFWENLSIKKKLLLSCGVAAFFFVAILTGISVLLNDLVFHADSALKKSGYATRITAREADHLVWTNLVGSFIQNQGETPLTVELDGNQCAFGKWFRGEGRTDLELVIPEVREQFAEVAEPHRSLHASAAQIKQLVADKRFAEAERLFVEKTEVYSRKVVDLLHAIRTQVIDRTGLDKKDYARMALYSKTATWILAGVSIFGALLFAIFITRAIARPLQRIADTGNKIAAGDLSLRIDMNNRKDEIGQIADSLNKMVNVLVAKISEADRSTTEARSQAKKASNSLAEVTAKEQRITQILDVIHGTSDNTILLAEELDKQATLLGSSAGQVRMSSVTQQHQLEEIATSMTQMTQAVNEIARSASNAAQSAGSTLEKAEQGSQVVVRSVDSIQKVNTVASRLKKDMEELGLQAQSIGQVMNVISDIADQTNLLALNAAIEAARAGDAGRGFAVVADEVRKLAEKTMQATQEVGNKISSIQQSVATGVSNMAEATLAMDVSTALAQESGESLQEIVHLAGLNTENAHNIAAAAEEHAVAANHILTNLGDITTIANQTVTDMGKATELITLHRHVVNELHSHINQLKKT